MNKTERTFFRQVGDSHPVSAPSGNGASSNTGESDADLLDAYSRAVVRVVESVGPAVVSVVAGKNLQGQRGDQMGAGSGVIVAPEGYILTNNHVVQGAGRLEVRTADGTTLPARLAGADPATDLAVLRTDAGGLPTRRSATPGRSRSASSR